MTEARSCQNCKNSFQIESEDFAFYEKIGLRRPAPERSSVSDSPEPNSPAANSGSWAPTWCPSCRFMRRLSFFNERMLYKRNCDLCGEDMIAMYAPDAVNKNGIKLVVYCSECYWSDRWDPAATFLEYDSSRPFLAQVDELIWKTPQVGLSTNYPTLVNSDYINHAGSSKNCYLIFTADNCENVMYSTILNEVKDTMDCIGIDHGELCYENISMGRCSRVLFSEDCADCTDLVFCKDCRGCNNCFGSMGLRKKNYCFFNEQLSKEEYFRRVKELDLHSRQGIEETRKRVREFWLTRPHRYAHLGAHNVNVSGDYIFASSKNSRDLHYAVGVEDSRFCQFLTMSTTKDSYDYTIWGNGVSRVYECLIVGEGADNVRFSNQCWGQVMDVEYSFWTTGSSHMFGCANIRKKKYCILNKQYTKEEFEKLRDRIIADMNKNPYLDSAGLIYAYGEFFPPEMSLHAYNESQANEFFPLSEAAAASKGYSWRTLPIPPQKPTISADTIPDTISQTNNSILSEILECAECARPFRITPTELALLRRFDVPVSNKCFNCRHVSRLRRMNPPHLYNRTCAKCSARMQSSYSQDRPEIVYCDSCYNTEIAS